MKMLNAELLRTQLDLKLKKRVAARMKEEI